MLAVNVVGLVALLAAPALAQPPSFPPSYPSGPAPGAQPNYPPAYPPGGTPSAQPGQQPGMFPYPPQYRPRALPTPGQRSAAAVAPEGGGGGTVMYFQKPADALTATGAADAAADGVAQLPSPAGGVPALPAPQWDAAVPPPLTPPSRAPAAAPYSAPLPDVGGTEGAVYAAGQVKRPDSGDTPPPKPKPIPEPPGGAAVTQLPSKERVFYVYNDAELEQAIMDRIVQDLLAANAMKEPKDRKSREYVIAQQAPFLKYPPLPVLSPPGVPYKSKTASYEPHQLTLEPGYVVHRLLYFEERNGERAGWDLGPLSTLVATTHFFVDTLLVPQTIASGAVHGYWDTSAGKCQPGSPTPYYLYPPGLTLTGSVFEAGVITGFAFLFP